ncbi:MAG: hypothetical protein JWM80_1175 [Cyanobacteria bacterium RYN_339]|nr:hypothetical protein [Cyanobacteria bacterium RYN_339]
MAEKGTCQCCGEEKVLNERLLCANCRTAQLCAVHDDLLTMQRCAFCRKPACAYCVADRLCQACRDEGHEAPERVVKVKKEAANADDLAQRKKLIKLGAVLVVAMAANYWFFIGGPPSPADVCKARLETAQGITMSYMIHHRNPPKTLSEIRMVAKAEKMVLPLMIPAGCRPIPGAVVYSFDGKQYSFTTYTDEGKVFTAINGKPMVMTVP